MTHLCLSTCNNSRPKKRRFGLEPNYYKTCPQVLEIIHFQQTHPYNRFITFQVVISLALAKNKLLRACARARAVEVGQ
jgi:hypothetical protein